MNYRHGDLCIKSVKKPEGLKKVNRNILAEVIGNRFENPELLEA